MNCTARRPCAGCLLRHAAFVLDEERFWRGRS